MNHYLFYLTSYGRGRMYNFIHKKLVNDGSFPCIVQLNNDNFVLLVMEQQCPYPGDENGQQTQSSHLASWPPWLRLMLTRSRKTLCSLCLCCRCSHAGRWPLSQNQLEDKAQAALMCAGPCHCHCSAHLAHGHPVTLSVANLQDHCPPPAPLVWLPKQGSSRLQAPDLSFPSSIYFSDLQL